MLKLDEITAETILIANLKGRKEKITPLLKVGEAIEYFLINTENNTYKKIAKKFKISHSIIASFHRMRSHPLEIKKLITEKKIRLDTSTKLLTIENPKRRIEIAKTVAGISSHDARAIIDFSKKNEELSGGKCKEKVLESKSVTKDLHVIVISLEDEDFKLLYSAAKKMKLTVDEASIQAVKEWTRRKRK